MLLHRVLIRARLEEGAKVAIVHFQRLILMQKPIVRQNTSMIEYQCELPYILASHRSDSLEALGHFVFVRAQQSENLEAEQRVLLLLHGGTE